MRQVADLSGVSEGTISRLEAGKMPNVAFDVIRKVARSLDVSLDDLANMESTEVTPPLVPAVV